MAKIITEIPSISNIGVPEAPIDGIQYGREDATWTPINDISYTDEQAQDAIGTILLDTVTIDLSYNDVTPSISADVKPNSIDATHLSNSINVSEFVNDSDYATEAYVDSKIPSNYSKVVYVDSNNPNTATIFDVNNPPTVNDDTLKTDVNNLYVGLNASTWVYNSTSLTYITEPITSGTSNFYLAGTLIDAGQNKIAAIERTGTVGGAPGTLSHHFVTKAQYDLKENSSNKTGTVTGNEASTSLYLHIAGMINYFQQKLTDAVFGAFQSVLPTVTTVANTDKVPFLIGSLSRMMTWANFKALFKTINGNSIFGSGDLVVSGGSEVLSYTHKQLTASLTWNVEHNIDNEYPCISIWSSIGEAIIPNKIVLVDSNNLNVLFPIAISGFATVVGNAGSPIVYDVDAQLFIDAVGTLNNLNKKAINNLVLNLKSNSLWSKMLMLNVKAGSNAVEHKWNLKDPRDLDIAYRQIYTGSWVHSVLGAKSNSTNTFADTKLNMSTLGLTGNLSFGFYVTEIASNFGDVYYMGAHSGSNNFVSIQKITLPDIITHTYGNGVILSVPNSKGFISVSVIGSTKKSYFDGVSLESTVITGTGVANANMYEGALNAGGRYGSLSVGLGTSFIGQGLTDTEMSNLRNAILQYETALGRN